MDTGSQRPQGRAIQVVNVPQWYKPVKEYFRGDDAAGLSRTYAVVKRLLNEGVAAVRVALNGDTARLLCFFLIEPDEVAGRVAEGRNPGGTAGVVRA
jgi:hypothetical protein